ncbi:MULTISPECIES: YdaS family helix-turn-helix protein [unclassified Cupriavidus]|jgi:DNA-binding transcriptional regulator YdaS (Cro superfamily)|uniref:YdaS family helix-turn-helix protein n=1 Tax=unclassified Cupriavidus TaxID=2640874 RepID=UPI000B86D7B9
MEKNQSHEALLEAARIAGSQSRLTAMCGKKQAHFHKWLNSPLGVPAEYCPLIEQGTGVTCERLRPDLAGQWQYLRTSLHGCGNPSPDGSDRGVS